MLLPLLLLLLLHSVNGDKPPFYLFSSCYLNLNQPDLFDLLRVLLALLTLLPLPVLWVLHPCCFFFIGIINNWNIHWV